MANIHDNHSVTIGAGGATTAARQSDDDLSGYRVKREWINPTMSKDRFSIYAPGGELVANVAYQVAHDFMLGRILPAELAKG